MTQASNTTMPRSPASTKKPRLTSKLAYVEDVLHKIKGLMRGKELTKGERLILLHVFYFQHREALLRSQNSNERVSVRAYQLTRDLTGRSVKTVKNVTKQWSDSMQEGNNAVDTVSLVIMFH